MRISLPSSGQWSLTHHAVRYERSRDLTGEDMANAGRRGMCVEQKKEAVAMGSLEWERRGEGKVTDELGATRVCDLHACNAPLPHTSE